MHSHHSFEVLPLAIVMVTVTHPLGVEKVMLCLQVLSLALAMAIGDSVFFARERGVLPS